MNCFLLHNTRADCQPITFGLILSDVGLAFADDGFGTYVSVDPSLAVRIVADGFDERGIDLDFAVEATHA